jgi:hypothetical protein
MNPLPPWHVAHAPFGTSGGGDSYLKWKRTNWHFVELSLITGEVRIANGTMRVQRGPLEFKVETDEGGERIPWIPFSSWSNFTDKLLPGDTPHRAIACTSADSDTGDTFLHVGAFSWTIMMNLVTRTFEVLRRTADKAPGAHERFDGYFYAVYASGLLRVTMD